MKDLLSPFQYKVVNRGISNFAMMKEFLMVMLLLQFSNGENVWVLKNVTDGKNELQRKAGIGDYNEYGSSTATVYTDFQNCIHDGGELLGRLKKNLYPKQIQVSNAIL